MRGRVWKFGDDVTTDHIIPGRLKYKVKDIQDMKKYVFHDVKPEFASQVREGDFIVAGKNFGYGSSREHAARLLKEVGIQAVIAKSFARIFFRNAINVGLPVIEAEVRAEEGDLLELDMASGLIRNLTTGEEFRFRPFPEPIAEILREGGIASYYRKRGKFPWD